MPALQSRAIMGTCWIHYPMTLRPMCYVHTIHLASKGIRKNRWRRGTCDRTSAGYIALFDYRYRPTN